MLLQRFAEPLQRLDDLAEIAVRKGALGDCSL
jgi:hypothetical protein